MARPVDEDFVSFVCSRQHSLLRVAHLACGDPTTAEDLVQDAFAKLASRWDAVREGSPDAYVRRIIFHDAVSGWRRWGRRQSVVDPAETGSPFDRPGHDALGTWAEGMGIRRRRQLLTSGGVLAGVAAVAIGFGVLGDGQDDAAVRPGPAVTPTADVLVTDSPEPTPETTRSTTAEQPTADEVDATMPAPTMPAPTTDTEPTPDPSAAPRSQPADPSTAPAEPTGPTTGPGEPVEPSTPPATVS